MARSPAITLPPRPLDLTTTPKHCPSIRTVLCQVTFSDVTTIKSASCLLVVSAFIPSCPKLILPVSEIDWQRTRMCCHYIPALAVSAVGGNRNESFGGGIRIFGFSGSDDYGIGRQDEWQGQLLGRRVRQPRDEVSGRNLLQSRNTICPGRQILFCGELQEIARSTNDNQERPPQQAAFFI
jgi:hypothetical protein